MVVILLCGFSTCLGPSGSIMVVIVFVIHFCLVIVWLQHVLKTKWFYNGSHTFVWLQHVFRTERFYNGCHSFCHTLLCGCSTCLGPSGSILVVILLCDCSMCLGPSGWPTPWPTKSATTTTQRDSTSYRASRSSSTPGRTTFTPSRYAALADRALLLVIHFVCKFLSKK